MQPEWFGRVNPLKVISLRFISDVQGPMNSCPDKPPSVLPSLQTACMLQGAEGWRGHGQIQGHTLLTGKICTNATKKKRRAGKSRVYYVFINMSTYAVKDTFV